VFEEVGTGHLAAQGLESRPLSITKLLFYQKMISGNTAFFVRKCKAYKTALTVSLGALLLPFPLALYKELLN